MTEMKNPKNIIKSIKQIMGIHKWNKDLKGLSDGESIRLNVLIEG